MGEKIYSFGDRQASIIELHYMICFISPTRLRMIYIYIYSSILVNFMAGLTLVDSC